MKLEMKKKIIPVLPVPNIVFFPNTALPLYIEEPSYIKLVRDCVESQGVMAISLAQPVAISKKHNQFLNRVQYRPSYICGVGKPMIIEEFGEKAIKVLIKGTGKIELLNLTQNLPYPAFEAKYIEEKGLASGFSNNLVERINSILREWININVGDSLEREAFFKGLTSVDHILDYVCMLLIQDRDIRQFMLETNSLYEKIHIINLLLTDASPLRENKTMVKALKHFEIVDKIARVSH